MDAEIFSVDSHGSASHLLAPVGAGSHAGSGQHRTAKPWLALVAIVCALSSLYAMTDDGMPTPSMSTSITILGFLGILFGCLSIRQQLFEKTASAAMFISVTSLIALAGLHLQ